MRKGSKLGGIVVFVWIYTLEMSSGVCGGSYLVQHFLVGIWYYNFDLGDLRSATGVSYLLIYFSITLFVAYPHRTVFTNIMASMCDI